LYTVIDQVYVLKKFPNPDGAQRGSNPVSCASSYAMV
jgi:hypothetical protein